MPVKFVAVIAPAPDSLSVPAVSMFTLVPVTAPATIKPAPSVSARLNEPVLAKAFSVVIWLTPLRVAPPVEVPVKVAAVTPVPPA